MSQDVFGANQVAFGADELEAVLSSGDYSGEYGIIGADLPAPPMMHPAVAAAHHRHQGHRGNPWGFGLGLEPGSEARLAFMRQLSAKNAALVVDRPMTKSRQLPLGFPAAALAGGGTVTSPTSAVSLTQPQVTYRGARLFVTPSALGVCIVQDFKVGKDSQLVAAEPVPAEMFSPLSFGSDMNLDTAQVSQIIALYLGNIGNSGITVTAGLIGTAVY